jgi:hypothetical protein
MPSIDDLSQLLQESDYVVLNTGTDEYVPLVVRRQSLNPLVYDPVLQGALAGPMVQVGEVPGAGQAPGYIQNLQLPLLNTVTSIAGVTNIFTLLDELELYQVFWGVAPRQMRVWLQQPGGSFVAALDQNIVPSQTYPDVGFLDGFDSPYKSPSRYSEFFSLNSILISFVLANPGPWPVNPRFYFLVNRLYVDPVTDPAIVQRLLKRTMPARYVSLGAPNVNLPWPSNNYGKIQPLGAEAGDLPPYSSSRGKPKNSAASTSVEQALISAGYLTASTGGS